jgi:hypothetical protein
MLEKSGKYKKLYCMEVVICSGGFKWILNTVYMRVSKTINSFEKISDIKMTVI